MSNTQQLTAEQIHEIHREIELAELMAKDLEKLWKSYAKKAQAAKEEREFWQAKKGFMEYETLEELTDGFGWGAIDEETYYRGRLYFESLQKPPELSVLETHRARIKELMNRYKGTVEELKEELDPPEKKPKLTAFEIMQQEQRKQRYEESKAQQKLDELFGKDGLK